jgi:hypothetical protein
MIGQCRPARRAAEQLRAQHHPAQELGGGAERPLHDLQGPRAGLQLAVGFVLGLGAGVDSRSTESEVVPFAADDGVVCRPTAQPVATRSAFELDWKSGVVAEGIVTGAGDELDPRYAGCTTLPSCTHPGPATNWPTVALTRICVPEPFDDPPDGTTLSPKDVPVIRTILESLFSTRIFSWAAFAIGALASASPIAVDTAKRLMTTRPQTLRSVPVLAFILTLWLAGINSKRCAASILLGQVV